MNSLQSRFNQLGKAHRYADLSADQWAILVENQSERALQGLDRLVSRAEKGEPEAVDGVKVWHKAVRLTDSLRAHGFPQLKVRETQALFEHVGQERVSNTAHALRNGDAPAHAMISRWLGETQTPRAAAGAGPAPSGASASAPPPAAAAGPSSRFTAVPPPPGARTAPVQRAAPAGNVHSLPPPAPRQDVRDDPRMDPARGASARRDDRRDDRYDEEPTGRHFAPAPPPPATTRNSAAEDSSNDRQYDQHSCYGRDVAVTFERTLTQDRKSKTVNFKVARAKIQGKTCKEGVDWQNAIVLMLEPHEVQIVYAVLMGFGTKCRFAGHGRDNQKWFEFEETTGDWAGAIRVTVGYGKDDVRKVNIGHTDLKEVMEVFSRTLQDQGKGQSPVFILAEVRRVFDLYSKKTAQQEASRPAYGGNQRRQA